MVEYSALVQERPIHNGIVRAITFVKRKLIQRPRLMIKAVCFDLVALHLISHRHHTRSFRTSNRIVLDTYEQTRSQEFTQAGIPIQSKSMGINSTNPLTHLIGVPSYQRLSAELLYRMLTTHALVLLSYFTSAWPYIDRLFFFCQAIFGPEQVKKFIFIHTLLYYFVGESELDGLVGWRITLFQDWYFTFMTFLVLWDATMRFWELLEILRG